MTDAWSGNLRPPQSWRQASQGLSPWRAGTAGLDPTHSSGQFGLTPGADSAFSGLGTVSGGSFSGLGPALDVGYSSHWWEPAASAPDGSGWMVADPNGTTPAGAAAPQNTAAEALAAPAASGVVGDPQGRIPDDLNIAFGRGASWDDINRYDAAIGAAAQRWKVDPALIKAAIAVESGGQEIWNGGNLAGRDPEYTSWGVLQMQRGYHREAAAQLGYDLDTADGQIGYFAALVSGNAPGYENIGNTPEERYATMYPGAGGTPEHVDQYMHDVGVIRGIVQDAAGQAGYGGQNDPATADPAAAGAIMAPAPAGSMTTVSDIWGGQDVAITQGIGSHDGEVYNNDAHIYDYCQDYGISGHCGVDYDLPVGTPIVAPINGTVISVAGVTADGVQGGRYFEDGAGGVGEIRVQAENGDIIIFGHMSTAAVRPGQEFAVGDAIGATGQSDSRVESQHLHLEVRVLQPDGTYRIADPNDYFAQQSTINSGGGGGGGGGLR